MRASSSASLQGSSKGASQDSQSLALKNVPAKGTGVFATRRFRAGEEVLQFVGEVRDVDAFGDLTHALQIGPRQFISSSGGLDDYVNHSCDPNCGIRDTDGRVVLFALVDIEKSSEITFDYATTQTGGFFVFDCQCGVAGCRGRVSDFNDVPRERQEFYLQRNALLGYLRATT